MFSGYYADGYRIAVHWPNIKQRIGGSGAYLKLKCKTATEYSACLHEIYALGCGYGEPIYTTTEKTWRRDRTCSTTADVADSMVGQEYLAALPSTEFIPYTRNLVANMFKNIEEGMEATT